MDTRKLLKDNAIWLVFVLMVAIFTVYNPKFIKPSNLMNIARQVAVYGIASVGMTFVILISGIDLSIGAIITFVNIICAYLMVNLGFNMWVAVIISITAATLIGVLNGFMVSTVGIPALIATFAAQTVFDGLSYIISGFILNKTYFGRYFYAIGGNEEAAKLSGIQVSNIKYLIYALSGFFAGLAGIVMLSRTGSAQNTAGLGYEFDVITCVVLGGVSVKGGIGRISGVIAGVLIIGSLTNGMILMDVNSYTQKVVKGLVLAIAVGIDCLSNRNKLA